MSMTTPTLERFVIAQQPVYRQVTDELRRGRKTSHWMWFIFPQIEGLGSSPMAMRYAITDLAEARGYLQHGVLGPRLIECTRLALLSTDAGADALFGYPDDLKFRSSMTLFAAAADDESSVFGEALGAFFEGPDAATLSRL
jgi:uncharacterized protein (DUF1810 family)